jgi:hypothetical protein
MVAHAAAILLATATLLAAGAGPAPAQRPGDVPADVPAESAQEQPITHGLRPPFATVRVRTRDGTYLSGIVHRTRPDTLLLRTRSLSSARTPVPHAAIDSIWVRTSAWKRGAAIGALAGTLLYVAIASGIDDDDPGAAAYMAPATLGEGIVMGLVFGGSTGSLIGSRFRRSRLHYPRP